MQADAALWRRIHDKPADAVWPQCAPGPFLRLTSAGVWVLGWGLGSGSGSAWGSGWGLVS